MIFQLGLLISHDLSDNLNKQHLTLNASRQITQTQQIPLYEGPYAILDALTL